MRADRILLAHGSGGTMMRELIDEVFVDGFVEEALKRLDDAASLPFPGTRIAMSTDTYVVHPLFFPGGDIGRLAVCGTVNDVATSGAKPLYLSVGFVLEEGFPIADLKRILVSMRDAAAEAGVHIVTGDTKVVEKGHGDGFFINTAGVGVLPEGLDLSGSQLQARRQGAALGHARRSRHRDRLDPRGPRVLDRASRPTPRRSTRSSPTCSRPLPTRAASATPPAAASPPRSTSSPTPPASRSPSTRPRCR